MFDWPLPSQTSPTSTSATFRLRILVSDLTTSSRESALASRASSLTVHLPSAFAVVLLVCPANSTTICSPASAQPHTGTALAHCSTM